MIDKFHPIEGFFVETTEGLLFDVKEISHPPNHIIAFVRYVPAKYKKTNCANTRKGFLKLYNLDERFHFLQEYFPEYLFQDPQGRGLLQAIPAAKVKRIFDPRIKLYDILSKINKSKLEFVITAFVELLQKASSLALDTFGISGSVLVDLTNESSDIDLIVYGKKNGYKLYSVMNDVFQHKNRLKRYTKDELKWLMTNRGQEKQLTFEEFFLIEKNKLLQGKIDGIDFYIRLVPYPGEWLESYQALEITQLGEIEVIAQIDDDSESIFTPAIYYLTEVEISTKNFEENVKPCRIYSVRGRYCEIAKKGDKIRAKGKLEKVKYQDEIFYQLVVGVLKDEYFIKSEQ